MKKINLRDAVGNPRGRNADKNHRVAKLMRDWEDIREKLVGMVVRGGGRTDTARLAYGVLLIMETGIRVGNEESAEGFVSINKWHEKHGQVVQTYGLTTLLGEHVTVRRGRLRLNFVGKKIVEQDLSTEDAVLLDYAPAPVKGERWLKISDAHLRQFVKRSVGRCFTPKDIRRAFVNRLFLERFGGDYKDEFVAAAKKADRNRVVRTAVEDVAARVGHTPGVCRSAYLSRPMQDVLKGFDPKTHTIEE